MNVLRCAGPSRPAHVCWQASVSCVGVRPWQRVKMARASGCPGCSSIVPEVVPMLIGVRFCLSLHRTLSACLCPTKSCGHLPLRQWGCWTASWHWQAQHWQQTAPCAGQTYCHTSWTQTAALLGACSRPHSCATLPALLGLLVGRLCRTTSALVVMRLASYC